MTDKRPMVETGDGRIRLKCVKNSVTVMYGVDALQQADRYGHEDVETTVLTGFGDKYYPEGETHEDRIRNAVEQADVIPERVREQLEGLEMEVDLE